MIGLATPRAQEPVRANTGEPLPITAIVLGVLLLAMVLLAGCAVPAGEPLPVRVCGTTDAEPVRLADHVCTNYGAPVDGVPVNGPTAPIRWYNADPECLDAGDRTNVGQLVNDDYIEGSAACDDRDSSPVIVGAPVPVPALITPTVKPSPAKVVPPKAAQSRKPTTTRTSR
jgi:hypothetical protein